MEKHGFVPAKPVEHDFHDVSRTREACDAWPTLPRRWSRLASSHWSTRLKFSQQ
jgi:hypothetical protein